MQSPLYYIIYINFQYNICWRKSYICVIHLFIKIYLVQNFRTFTYKIFYVNSCVLHLTMQTFAKTKFNYVNSSLPGKIISYNVTILRVSVSPELLYHFAHGFWCSFVLCNGNSQRILFYTCVYVCVSVYLCKISCDKIIRRDIVA